jgi:hypothetical protein
MIDDEYGTGSSNRTDIPEVGDVVEDPTYGRGVVRRRILNYYEISGHTKLRLLVDFAHYGDEPNDGLMEKASDEGWTWNENGLENVAGEVSIECWGSEPPRRRTVNP